MTAVFLDTAGLISNWDTSAQWHQEARQAYQVMLAQRRPVVTSTYVLLECGNSAARRPYRAAVARFREEMEAAGCVIVPTDDDWREAWKAYERGDGADAGIVDHVSFVLMRRPRITDVFTNDRHFRAGGFHPLY
jgi:predicted nucleic acid-binding protein